VDGAAKGNLAERFLLHANAVRHGQKARHVVIVDDQHLLALFGFS
jgi:hypothetical protein